MSALPRTAAADSTAAFLREGYRFIPARCARHGAPAFRTRLLLRPVVCASGADAAAMFYSPGRFTRHGALPPTTVRLLQDLGSVQAQDGAAHTHRKRLFMTLLAPDAARHLAALAVGRWRERLPVWRSGVVLHDVLRGVLCEAACRWAGIPLAPGEGARRTRELAAMIEQAGSFGAGTARALWLRRCSERWARALVERVRAGRLVPPPDSALAAVAAFRDRDGLPLDSAVAAVELVNLLRPTVAIARFVVFAAHALHAHPQWRRRLREDRSEPLLECFVQEVRRLYPFFPAVGGRVREAFSWRGHDFGIGDWVLFDLYGTNRDPHRWHEPERFDPTRFAAWDGNAWDFVAQGAGDAHLTHRCPGERATIEVMKAFVALLAREVEYEVPPQDLAIDLSRMPALPASGMRLVNLRAAASADG
ncbi:cytochrome P450 [Coralloluteibacterium stylophorae]|uniref:Cytochrome P450 n=1 Tax=Coralloluteibacterium stylophorae TaxID=1776034 RepID=A0A8J8AXS2_9GAMM|nr:cytochrome P450 [Coralloluteibacterium stylophorae]MBS7458635.1 cytochrome P450 [Coralloluteibacterium stylophorae]